MRIYLYPLAAVLIGLLGGYCTTVQADSRDFALVMLMVSNDGTVTGGQQGRLMSKARCEAMGASETARLLDLHPSVHHLCLLKPNAKHVPQSAPPMKHGDV